jgi:beta-catenin-like protein 1
MDREDNAGEEGEVIGREAFGERDVKKLASGLDRAVSANESRRAKFDDPTKYIESEADLFTAVASFVVLSEYVNLYPALVESGAVETLMRLFAHENVDIAISVLEVLVELTGEDVEYENESDMASFMDALFKEDAIEVMIGNLERLSEEKDDDQQGVFHTLSTAPLNIAANI